MLTEDSLGAFFFMLVALASSIALLISSARAPTKARTYIYSPTKSPYLRTPKWTFAVGAGVAALNFAVWGFLSYLHPRHPEGTSAVSAQAMQVLDPLAHGLLWIAIAAMLGAGWLLFATTRPLHRDPASTTPATNVPPSTTPAATPKRSTVTKAVRVWATSPPRALEPAAAS